MITGRCAVRVSLCRNHSAQADFSENTIMNLIKSSVPMKQVIRMLHRGEQFPGILPVTLQFSDSYGRMDSNIPSLRKTGIGVWNYDFVPGHLANCRGGGVCVLPGLPYYGQKLRGCGHVLCSLWFRHGCHAQRHCQHAGYYRRIRTCAPGFFVVPLVGSLFVDFVNSAILTMFISFFS